MIDVRRVMAIIAVVLACLTLDGLASAQIVPAVSPLQPASPSQTPSQAPSGLPPAVTPMLPPRTSPLPSASELSAINPLEVLDIAGTVLAPARGAPADQRESLGPQLADAGGARDGSSASRGRGLSPAINILLVLTVIGLVPSIMLMTTCFVRFVIVLGLLKQALGTQTLPPPQVVVGLAMFMTFLVMAPTFDRINQDAVVPYRAGVVTDYNELWSRVKQPMRDFMFDQIEATDNWSGVYMILNYRGVDTSRPETLTTDHVDMISLIPAFMLSELKTAFLIGFKVYLPFLVIDMVISAILIAMGMMMLPPVLISLPFKLLLFVMVDGWQLVVGSLMNSFVQRASPAVTAYMREPPPGLAIVGRSLGLLA
jgi:flagellar biosynthesis protein FliP